MLELLPQSTDQAIALLAKGKLTDTDYQQVMIPRLRELIAKHGKARVMLVLAHDFRGWEPKAAWDDAKFGLKHRKDFAKLAMVGAPKWVKWATDVGANFMSGEVRTYGAAQEPEAWGWVSS